ncbi:hypothetical protein X777_07054 [Ooceraea biroi]|uniref:Uncharacterized protein n=1 Tax=Ooceraea biroi TaxID=2015173 RepID=A0A026W9P2_OOCBI|nr:hypothetical protein X777_07054 [Ooceraea biroi]
MANDNQRDTGDAASCMRLRKFLVDEDKGKSLRGSPRRSLLISALTLGPTRLQARSSIFIIAYARTYVHMYSATRVAFFPVIRAER